MFHIVGLLPDIGDQARRDNVRLVLGKSRDADLLGDRLDLAGFHSGLRPFPEPVVVVISDSRTRAALR